MKPRRSYNVSVLVEALLVGFGGATAALMASWGVYPRVWSETPPGLDPEYYIHPPVGSGPRALLAVLGALLLVAAVATVWVNVSRRRYSRTWVVAFVSLTVCALVSGQLLGVLTTAAIGANIGGPFIIGVLLVLIGVVFFRFLRSLESIEL